nr:hypothetical protein CFP56_36678 [Quercus suber]
MLDLVGELSRVALENACATASEATTQATSYGGRGGGPGGCGRSGGHGGRGGGPDDEDDSDDEALEGDWDTYMDGVGSSRCTQDETGQGSCEETKRSPKLGMMWSIWGWRRWGKNERELEEKEGVWGMGRAKMEKLVVEERVVMKKVVEEERVMEGVVAMEGMEIEAKEAEGIHMVGSKEETLRHSKILKIPADFHIE